MPMCRRAPANDVWLASPAGAESRCHGDRRTAEIQRAARRVHHDLHDVRIHELLDARERHAERGHVRIRVVLEQARDLIDQRRRDERLIALHVHDDVARGPAARARDLSDAIRARRMRRLQSSQP